MNPKDRHCYGCQFRTIHCHERCKMYQEDDAAHQRDLQAAKDADFDRCIQCKYICERTAEAIKRAKNHHTLGDR